LVIENAYQSRYERVCHINVTKNGASSLRSNKRDERSITNDYLLSTWRRMSTE